jgi:trk system potassium uptake protein TrkA
VPRIVARAFDDRHSRLLFAMGAHEVLNPEEESGERLALHMAYPTIVDQLQLGEATIAEIEAPEAFVGRHIESLDLRRQFLVTLLAIRRQERTHSNPAADDEIESGDVLVLLGSADAIRAIAALR